MDGVSEIMAIGTKMQDPSYIGALTEFSTLFSDDKKAASFYLFIFSQKDDELKLDATIFLGKRFVFGGLSRISIKKQNAVPFIISVGFQIQEGTEQEWLIFQGDSLSPSKELHLKDTFLSHLLIQDVDKDGNIDVILQERAQEESIGYETYLAWLKWDGKTFVEYATTNIVRNLRQFLQTIKKQVLDREWRALLNYGFRAEDIQQYKQKGLSDSSIVLLAFGFTRPYEKEFPSSQKILNRIQDIIFPEFLENPFLVQDAQGNSFNISFRIENSDGTSHVSEIALYIAQNPFSKKQFFFVLQD
jgi:hypothetical protein